MPREETRIVPRGAELLSSAVHYLAKTSDEGSVKFGIRLVAAVWETPETKIRAYVDAVRKGIETFSDSRVCRVCGDEISPGSTKCRLCLAEGSE